MADRYTRFVLTVIAGCLLWLTFMDSPAATPVQAQLENQRVVLSGWVDGEGVVRKFPTPREAGVSPPRQGLLTQALPIFDTSR